MEGKTADAYNSNTASSQYNTNTSHPERRRRTERTNTRHNRMYPIWKTAADVKPRKKITARASLSACTHTQKRKHTHTIRVVGIGSKMASSNLSEEGEPGLMKEPSGSGELIEDHGALQPLVTVILDVVVVDREARFPVVGIVDRARVVNVDAKLVHINLGSGGGVDVRLRVLVGPTPDTATGADLDELGNTSVEPPRTKAFRPLPPTPCLRTTLEHVTDINDDDVRRREVFDDRGRGRCRGGVGERLLRRLRCGYDVVVGGGGGGDGVGASCRRVSIARAM